MDSGKKNKPMLSLKRIHLSKNHCLLFTVVIGLVFCYNNNEINALYYKIVASTTSSKKQLTKTVNYEKEYPYNLTCPYFEIPSDSDIKIALAYHVGMMSNWKNVVNDQLHTLSSCGLGYAAKDLLLSYTSQTESSPDEILELMKPYDFSLTLKKVVESKRVPWEGEVMNAIQEYCSDQPDAIVFYFHSKGVSRYSPDWQEHQEDFQSYAHSLYWRKFMEYFTIERPEICINKILGTNHDKDNEPASEAALACSANMRYWPQPHYSGNIWVASCKHLRTLPQINFDGWYPDELRRYISAEMWVGGNYDSQKFINLWDQPLSGPEGLAQYWIRPVDYWPLEDLLKLNN